MACIGADSDGVDTTDADVAVAAALVRREDESFLELLARLDQAIDKAINQQVFTDESNR